MKITDESQLLDQGVRKKLIDEITDSENIDRKNLALRRHEVYRDQTKKWVMHALINEGYKQDTLFQMENRAANISIAKKIVNKRAQTYLGGVERTVEDDASSQESIEALADILDFNARMKELDRANELHKTALLFVLPKVCGQDEELRDLYTLQLRVFYPFEFDVIEDPKDQTRSLAIILTEFTERVNNTQALSYVDSVRGADGYRTTSPQAPLRGDGVNQAIADSREDEGENRRFIFWTNNFHFTTDAKGIIVEAPEGNANPIGMIPAVTVATNQDGYYWGQGGDDVVDGCISINKQLTDLNFIAWSQGWGQMVITGKSIPKELEGGPNRCLKLEHDAADPTPQVFFAASTPNLSEMLESIKAQLGLLLSTNDLSARNLAVSLEPNTAQSGIAMIVEQSELTHDIQDKQQLFQDAEPKIWEVIRLWHELYSELGALDPELAEVKPFASSDVSLKFHQLQAAVTEKERLEVMKLRKDIGLDSMIDLIKRDNPDLTDEEAQEKLDRVNEEKAEAAAAFAEKTGMQPGKPGETPPKPGEKKDDDGEQPEPEPDDE